MADPILYFSMFLGLGGVYIFISSFHDDDDDDGDDDGERFLQPHIQFSNCVV